MTSTIRIFRPKLHWSLSPANLLPTGLLFRLVWPNPRFTVLLDDQPVDKIGKNEERVLTVEPGEHRLCLRFVGLRRSEEVRIHLEQDEERQFTCGTSAMGWPTLREASPEEVAAFRSSSAEEPR